MSELVDVVSLYILYSQICSVLLISFVYIGRLTEPCKIFVSFGVFLVCLVTHDLSTFSLLTFALHLLILRPNNEMACHLTSAVTNYHATWNGDDVAEVLMVLTT